MGQARGYKSQLVIDWETAYGVAPASPAGLVMPINTYTLKSKRPKNTANTITGTRNPVKPFDGRETDAGEAEVPVDSTAFGHWLKACFGVPVTTGTGPYTHVFKVGDLMPSMINEVRFADASAAITYAHHTGVRVSSLSMATGGDGELVAKLALEGQQETFSATPYDATPTTVSLNRFNNFQVTYTEGGVATTKITEADFNINFGLDTEQYSGALRNDIPEGLLAVTGSITAIFDSETLLQKAINSTESSLVFTFTSGTHSLAIALNELQYERDSPGIEGPKGIKIKLPFAAYMDDHAAASVVVATLINSTASYA